jgi:FkbM family methyltransferase
VFDGNSTYYGHPVTAESFSSLSRKLTLSNDPRWRMITVPMLTLDVICAGRGIEHVDLLTVDVEGDEIEVMRGLSHNPRVVVLENLIGDSSYCSYMEQRGYAKHGYNLHNDIWVRR